MSVSAPGRIENVPILQVENLSKYFARGGGFLSPRLAPIRAVDGVSFTVADREALGIVGESGCGKSTIGLLIMRLLDASGGRIVFEGTDITQFDRRAMRPLRRRLQMVFQDPYSSLSPRMTIRQILGEPLEIQGDAGRVEIGEKIERALRTVGLRSDFLDRYPHELSGGQRQRIGIARALIGDPRLIIADEAVSALDVSIQAQILNLLAELREKLHLSLIFISHDISVVQHLCDRIAVMYLGRIVEIGTADDIVMAPMHPYTEALLSAVPSPRLDETKAQAHRTQRRYSERQHAATRLPLPHPLSLPPRPVHARRSRVARDRFTIGRLSFRRRDISGSRRRGGAGLGCSGSRSFGVVKPAARAATADR